MNQKNKLMGMVGIFILIGVVVYVFSQRDDEFVPPPPPLVDTSPVVVEPPSVAEEPPSPEPPEPLPPPSVAEPSPVETPAPQVISCRASEPGAQSSSASAIQTAITTLIGKQTADQLFSFGSLIRHFVVTVDNLPRKKIPRRYAFTRRVPGQFQATAQDDYDNALLDQKNFERYAGFVSLAEQADPDAWVSLYIDFCPLFQQAYEELGYPDRAFHDRLLEVIDHILDAPEIDQPIKLVRPKVFYLFADPALESLSAGHKIMIRIGNDNAARVKTELRALRSALAELPLE